MTSMPFPSAARVYQQRLFFKKKRNAGCRQSLQKNEHNTSGICESGIWRLKRESGIWHLKQESGIPLSHSLTCESGIYSDSQIINKKRSIDIQYSFLIFHSSLFTFHLTSTTPVAINFFSITGSVIAAISSADLPASSA